MLFGYSVTAAVGISFVSLLVLLVISRKEIMSAFAGYLNRYSLLALALIVIFFIFFALRFVSPAEQLYFDENIYQGIALNILNHGNALWCQYGTAKLGECFSSVVYHDPVGWTFFIAIAFALFGIGTSTAFALQLFVGALSIIAIFLLASVLTERKSIGVMSAFIFALMPELFIWSRTQADLDLSFMMFSTLTFLFFVLFIRKQNLKMFAIFCFSLLITLYLRLEAILLLPLFIILYLIFDNKSTGLLKTLTSRFKMMKKAMDTNLILLLMILAFIVLLTPEVYYISLQAGSPDYGQSGVGKQLFSIANFANNSVENANYLLGNYNQLSYYPAMFPQFVTILAVIGVAICIIGLNRKSNRGTLLLLALWFITYFLFYGFFYAGGAVFGVDVRFMLQLMPSISILAAIAIMGIADIAIRLLQRARRGARSKKARPVDAYVSYAVCIIMLALLVAYPFYGLANIFTIPVSKMPQQGVIAPAVAFVNSNYTSLPNNCMIFTFTPDVWYELNRSAAQVSYIDSSNSTVVSNLKGYSCFGVDYGYWCNVPPYHSGFCNFITSNYKLQPLSQEPNANGNFTIYRLLNYTP